MPDLAPIVNSSETIAAAFQSSINAAFTELHSLFGFWPRVLSPYGGARTKAECIHEGLSWTISDHYEAADGRAAVDIDNQREFRDKNEALFLSTMAKYGWHNMTTTGAPFPTEPWHFAKHGVSTAGEGSTPIDNTTKDNRMLQLILNPADKAVAPKVRYQIAGAGGVFPIDFANQAAADNCGAYLRAGNTPYPSIFGLTDDAAGWAVMAKWLTPPTVSGGGPAPIGPLKVTVSGPVTLTGTATS